MCEICGFPSSKRLYSVQSCYLCTNFFREFFINGPDDLVCNGPNPNQCSVLGEETCKACRYQKCLELGMDGSRIRKRKGRSRKCTIIKKRSSRLNLVSSTEEVTVEHVHPKEVTVEHVNPEEVTVEHVYPEEVTVEHVHPEEITVEHVHPVRNHSPPIPKKKELVRSRKPFINPKRRSARIIPVSSMEEITVEHVHPVRNHSPPIPKKKELSTTLARKRKRRSRKPFTIIKKRSSRLNPVSSNKEVTVEKVHSVQNHSPPIPKEKKRKTFKGPKRRSARLNPVSSTEEVTVERVHPEEITVEQVQPEEVTVEQVHPEEITVEHVHPVQNPLPPTPKEQQLVHALKLHAVKVRLFNRNYEAEQLLEDFVREERLANDRRKFLYSSDSSFANLLASVNAKEIPYSSMNLQPLTFEKTRKHMRSEIIIIYEWIRGWRHFDLLNTQDRVIFLRRCVLYHTILDSCYHSHRMGLPDKFIMFNGMYVGVQPGDKTGWEDETDCITSDLKMKLYRPLMDRLINEVCASMNAIGLSFEEFVILKALVSFKLSSCSNVSSGLKKFLHGHMVTILRALNEHYQESGMSPEEIAHRTGNVILMMSSIFTIGKECRESHQMIQFFELWQLDDLHIKLIQGGGGANES